MSIINVFLLLLTLLWNRTYFYNTNTTVVLQFKIYYWQTILLVALLFSQPILFIVCVGNKFEC